MSYWREWHVVTPRAAHQDTQGCIVEEAKWMKRSPRLVALLGLALFSCVLLAWTVITGSRGSQGPVYSVAQVQAGLADRRHTWVGRAVLVRGRAMPCRIRLEQGRFSCAPAQPNLSDPVPDGDPLVIVPQDPPAVVAWLFRWSPLGQLLPMPQMLHWGVVATYQVRLQATPQSICASGVCFEALLLDAAPSGSTR
jgi:hypothetical protein